MRDRALVLFAALTSAASHGDSTLTQPGPLSAAPALSVIDATNGGTPCSFHHIGRTLVRNDLGDGRLPADPGGAAHSLPPSY